MGVASERGQGRRWVGGWVGVEGRPTGVASLGEDLT